MYGLVLCLLCFKVAESFISPINLYSFPLNFSTSNNLCQKDLDLFQKSLENDTLWAYQFWESTAKFPLGLLQGSQYQLGDFDECLSIKEPFKTKYCLATIELQIKINWSDTDPFNLKYRPYSNLYEKIDYKTDPAQIPRNIIYWGLCIPRSCEAENIRNELENELNKKHSKYIKNYDVILNENDCDFEGKNREYTILDYIFCIIIFSLFIFIVICTILDYKYINEINQDTKALKMCLCFSAKQNIEDVCKSEGSNKKFKIFYGTKFILTVGLVCGHGFVNMMTGSVFNFINIEMVDRTFMSIPITRGDVMVDIFFLIGAILNTYSYLDQKSKRNYNMARTIIIRYFRSMPSFALVSFFYTTFLYKISSGPLWPKIIGAERDYCTQNWWTNILFMNNYIDIENQCIMQGWYIAADFQLFLLSMPLNYLIWKDNKYTWIAIILFLCISILIPFLTVYLNNMDPFYYIFNNFFMTIRKNNFYKYMYIPGHTRMSPYIIGMIFGYFYYKYKDRDIKLSKLLSIFIFSKLTVAAAACMFGGIVFFNPYNDYSALKSALYAALHRPAFVLATGIILFLSSYECIPLKFLSWNIMIPLSKLSFGVYLTHFVLQQMKVAARRVPVTSLHFYWVRQTIENTCLCLMIAFVLFIFIENPFGKLIKEILPKNFLQFNKKIQPKENNVP